MSSRPPYRSIKKQRQSNIKQKYAELSEKYFQGEFTYEAHCIIEKLTEKGRCEPHMQGVELYKILLETCKVLLLNQLQILFFGAILQEMKWKVIDPCLNVYLQSFKGLNHKMKQDNYNKKMQLSLLLIGFVVKLYLNQEQIIKICELKIREFVTKDCYDKMYQEWVAKMSKYFKFNPKNMNKLFQEFDIIRAKKTMELDHLNYNSKVFELFDKYVSDDVKEHQSREQRTPIQEEEYEEQPVIPQSIIRNTSLQSIRSLNHRQSSFRQLLNPRQQDNQNMFLRHNSLFRNTSQDYQFLQ